MLIIRNELPKDAAAREALLDLCFGDARFAKASERLREGRLPALSLAASDHGRLIGTVRLWNVTAGRGQPALLLGPLAVRPEDQGRGIGSALMRRAIADTRRLGHRAVLLVGDEPYYGRFGFSAAKTGGLWLRGGFDPRRLLALELVPDALADARGLISPTGTPAPRSAPAARTLRLRNRSTIPQAA